MATQWMRARLRCARVDSEKGCGDTEIDAAPPITTGDDRQRLALAGALYSAAGLAGELVRGRRPDEARATSDIAPLQQSYQAHREEWPWAKHFDMFKSALIAVAEQAIRNALDAFTSIAGQLRAHQRISQADATFFHKVSPWFGPGTAWWRNVWALVDQAKERLQAEEAAWTQRQDFAARHAAINAAVAAQQPVKGDGSELARTAHGHNPGHSVGLCSLRGTPWPGG
jgi:hypothetical protein